VNGGGEYKVYKRRWFGLVQLVLLNIVVSWDVSCPQPCSRKPLYSLEHLLTVLHSGSLSLRVRLRYLSTMLSPSLLSIGSVRGSSLLSLWFRLW
jgi:hypothetical protein